MIAALALSLLAQSPPGWRATPARPTVGDTIRLERFVPARAGWRLRADRLVPGESLEPLGEPTVREAAGGWLVRYPVAAWVPGTQSVAMPALWRLGPDGSADSLPGGTATVTVASVIPDSVTAPAPQPALGPLRPARRRAWPPLTALVLSVTALAGLVAWRRRGPRTIPPPPPPSADRDVADARWLAAGEPKAVAARAAHQLRLAIAHAVPTAHEALSTAECLAVLERARTDAPLRELRELLGALDQVAFATAHGDDVARLAARARALARDLVP